MDCELGGPVSNLIEDGFGLRSRSHLACSRGVKATTLATLALTSVSASESFHFGQTAQHNIAKLQNCETAVQTVNCIFQGRQRERAKIMRPAERFVNYALQSVPSLPLWQPLGVAVAVGFSWQPQKFCCTICALTKPKQFNCRQASAEFPA